MTTFTDFWGTDRWTREYGWRPAPGQSSPYTLGYHIGQDIGGRTWLSDVPALRSGKVVRVGRSPVIGGYVVVQATEDGRYDGYAHLNTSPNNRPGVGEWVKRGDPMGKLARSTLPWAGDDYTGSGSDGPHLHFTISYKADNSWNPAPGYDVDPRPYIRSALRGPELAGGGATPFEPEIPKEWDEMATKQEIKDAVSEVVSSTLASQWMMHEQSTMVFLVKYESSTWRNGWHLAGPGFFHTFNSVEWEHFNWLKSSNGQRFLRDLATFTPPTDEAFDLLRNFALSLK